MKITKHQNTSILPILQPGQGFTWTPERLKEEELATWDSISPEIKQLTQDINNKEYEEHRRNNDVKFTGEKALESEDWKFAAALAGGIGTAQAASTMGWVPAITTDVASGIGGTAAGYGSNWVGQKIDNKFGTNVTPWLTTAGSLLGGIGGGIAGYRRLVDLGAKGLLKGYKQLYGKSFYSDVAGDIFSKSNMVANSNAPLRHYMRHSLGDSHKTHIYDTLTGKDIGQISTESVENGVDRVRRIQGDPDYRWKGRSLYSAETMETPKGLVSGENLEMPEATIPTWKHFDHEVIGDYGLHGNKSGQPVVRLKYAETYLPKVEPKIIEHSPTKASNIYKIVKNKQGGTLPYYLKHFNYNG